MKNLLAVIIVLIVVAVVQNAAPAHAAVNLAPILPAAVTPGNFNSYRVLVTDSRGRPLANKRLAYKFSANGDRRSTPVSVRIDSNGWATIWAAPPAIWSGGVRWINFEVRCEDGQSNSWRVAR